MAIRPRTARTSGRLSRNHAGQVTGSLLFHVVRQCHIFASAVREALEEAVLREICSHPITSSQFHLLRLLSLNGLHQLGEAAGFLGVSAPAATKNADKLEALGLLARVPSPDDRRAMLISVSPKGRRLVKAYEDLSARRLRRCTKHFRPQDLRQFARFMEHTSIALLQSTALEDGFCPRCAGYIEDFCPISGAVGGCTYQELRRARVRKFDTKTIPDG